MSGPAAGVGGGYGGLYHGHGGDPAAVGQLCYFQQQSVPVPPCAAGAGDGDGTTTYASIADYLQGFLDHEGLAAHFGSDDVVDGQLAGAAPAASSSVLSSSGCCEAGAGADHETPRREGRVEGDGEAAAHAEADRNCKRRSNEKKTRGENEKKAARGPRVAFATKSEVDQLEDGYRWRKYGQKAVKNSTYPRSYYRCTAARCGVKKRVERSQQDPSTVVTTYEGQHTHPSPVVGLRLGGGAALMRASSACGSPLHRLAGFVRPATTIDGANAAGGSGSFLPLLPGGMGGGGQLSSSSLPSMRRRPFLLQEPQHHRAHPSQQPAVDAYGGVLDLVPTIPR